MIGSHIIPKAYLEQFAIRKKARDETGRFFVYEKGKLPRRAAPKAEGVENGYFAFVRPDGSIDESLENSLAAFRRDRRSFRTPRSRMLWREIDARDLDDGLPGGFLAGAIVDVWVALRLNWA